MAAIVVASMLVAPVGARSRIAGRRVKLRRAFAALLFTLGAYMFWKSIRG